MQLARVFTDYIVLQRDRPILLWGRSDAAGTVPVRLNGRVIAQVPVEAGLCAFLLPAQPAMEDAVLEVGSVRLCHVDIGEVWVAGGQSNMEFLLKYTEGGEEEAAQAADPHLRMYTVGQYSFAGERELGYKAWEPWDKWLPYAPENAGDCSAVGVYFARQLRRAGVPVGILSCSWGGTSASAWAPRARLAANPAVKSYVEDFDAAVAALDLPRYHAIKAAVRPGMASHASREMMGVLNKYTFKPGEMEKKMAELSSAGPGGAPKAGPDLSGISMAELLAVGPGDPNEPGALFENMVREIAGYSARGVIWYQGESDDKKPDVYQALFTEMVQCWRAVWSTRNPAVGMLPFLTVQLAPYGCCRGQDGAAFPLLRAQQEQAAKTIPGVYMTSISDIGNVFDIHPKVKRPVGERLALLAQKYVYDDTALLADAPEAAGLTRQGDVAAIAFANGEGLAIRPAPEAGYNGFALADIPAKYLPPILGGVNGLAVWADGAPLQNALCRVEKNRLLIQAPALAGAQAVTVQFAQTPFYRVNLYNRAGIPAKPFVLTGKGEGHHDEKTGL